MACASAEVGHLMRMSVIEQQSFIRENCGDR
jgi:hypothetical protein